MVAKRKYTCSNTKLHKISSFQSPNKQKDSAIKLLRTHDKQVKIKQAVRAEGMVTVF